MLTDNKLKSQIDALWNRFWSGGITNPLNAIEQFSYLIFLKRLEDMENSRTRRAKEKKKIIQPYMNATCNSVEKKKAPATCLLIKKMISRVRNTQTGIFNLNIVAPTV